MKYRKVTVVVICWIFFILFVYTGVLKYIDFKITEYDVHRYPLLYRYSTEMAYYFPAVEILVAFLVVIDQTRTVGLWVSTVLMGLLTWYVSVVLSADKGLPCSCGGLIRELNWHQHLYFNIILTIISLIGAVLNMTIKDKFSALNIWPAKINTQSLNKLHR